MHFTDFVDHAGVIKNTLGQRCLARINMSGNANVARSLEWILPIGEFGFDGAADFCSSVAGMIKKWLPAEMGEGAIGLRHFVGVVAFLDCVTLSRSRVFQFRGKGFRHGRPRRPSAYWTIQRMAREIWRAGETSTGT
jgi:hypothetical protein